MSTPEDQAGLESEARAVEGEYIPKDDPRARAAADDGDGAAAGVSTAEVIAAALKPTFDIMAPAWEVTDTECKLLGVAYGGVVDKYFPNFDFGVELTAVAVSLVVFGPRWNKPRKHESAEAPPAAPPAE